MKLQKDRFTIMLVLTGITIITLIVNIIVGANIIVIIILSLVVLAEVIWMIFWLNGRGRQ